MIPFITKRREEKERQRRREAEELRQVAAHTVLFYFQSWGQGIEGRVEALNLATAAAGINAVFRQHNGIAGWEGDPKEGERAIRFRDELDTCWPKGQFEDEEAAVAAVIQKWRAS